MAKYPVLKSFRDKQDDKYLNKKNKFYPREGLEVTDERVQELRDKGFLGDPVDEEEAADEVIEDNEFPKATGGGWYELSNGERVQGKKNAVEREEALK